MSTRTRPSSSSAPYGGHALAVACEPLERRALLSLAVAGPEFLVNSVTTGAQSNPAVAADADGDFVVAWESNDGSAHDIFAQRFSAAGVALGGEFRVNTYTTDSQNLPTVATDADGDFVVAWQSANQDGYGAGVYARRFNSAGVAQGGEFRANTYTARAQSQPVAAMDAAGNFVIAWSSFAQTGPDQSDIYAQRYDPSGVPQGDEFLVNGSTGSSQSGPAVAMDASGDFVIAWVSTFQETPTAPDPGIYSQRFNAAGVAQGGEIPVNTYTTSDQVKPSIAIDADGDFVVAWQSLGQDGSGIGVYAQRFDGDGAPQGAEFRANTFTTSGQGDPSAAMDADGDFLITWDGPGQEGPGFNLGVVAKRYDRQGNELPRPAGSVAGAGNEFRVNTYTTGFQSLSTAALDAEGNAVIVWTGEGAGDDGGIFAQRYAEPTDTAGPIVAGVFVNGRRVTPYSAHESPLQQIVVSFSESLTTAGANGVTNPANWLLTRNGADVSSSIGSISFSLTAANRYEAVIHLAPAQTSGNFTLVARDTIRDLAGNGIDGNLDGTPGGNAALSFAVAAAGPVGGEFRVNTFTTDSQRNPMIAAAPDGRFVVTWLSRNQSGNLNGIYAQRYDASGSSQGGETLVAVPQTGEIPDAGVAMNAAGDYVISWKHDAEQVGAQRYTADGAPLGGPVFVGGSTSSEPKVAMHVDRSFVVTWSAGSPNLENVFAQRYDAAGNQAGGIIAVNSYTPDFQRRPEIAMDADGDFVIAWSGQGPASGGTNGDSFAQRYNAQGVPQGGNFQVNDPSTLNEAFPRIGMNPGGDFAIAWHRTGGGTFEPADIYARRFSSTGVPLSGEIPVSISSRIDSHPAVAMDATGNFVVTWPTAADASPNPREIYARRYNASGTALEGEFRVHTYTTYGHLSPRVAMDADGDFVVTWWGAAAGDLDGVFAQRFGNRPPTVATPTVGTLTDSPDPVPADNAVTLSASNVTDDGTVASVSFYRESNGVAGLQVGFQGDAFLVTQTQFINDAWTAQIPTAGLAGTYTYWAQATDDAGLTGAPASTTNTVIPVAPVVNSWGFQYATLPQRIAYQFNQNVSASLGLDDILIQQLPGGPTVTPSGLSYHAPTNTATFSFDTPLPDGRYRARLIAAGINGPGGPPMAADHTFEFTFLRGDANGDGRVNLADFNVLAANFGQSPRDFTQGDFDYSGNVNLTDFNLLASRFGLAVGPTMTDAARDDAGDKRLPDELDKLLG